MAESRSCDQGWSNKTWLYSSCSGDFHLHHWGKLYSIASAIFSFTQGAGKNNSESEHALFPICFFNTSTINQYHSVTISHYNIVKEIAAKKVTGLQKIHIISFVFFSKFRMIRFEGVWECASLFTSAVLIHSFGNLKIVVRHL